MEAKRVSHMCTVILMLLIGIAQGAKVGKWSYNGLPEDLQGKTVSMPVGTVAMNENVHIDIPKYLVKGGSTDSNSAIMFVIDNSGSMWDNTDPDIPAMDPLANRYKVTSKLIDSIYAKNPDAEVGLSIFGYSLYFDVTEDSIFEPVRPTDKLGYIPLLKLDSTYTSTLLGQKTGKEILQYFLQTNTKNSFNPLVYESLDFMSSTNITAGFDGATSAFSKTSLGKDRQFIIFISDGDANTPLNNPAEMYRFQDGINVPTTFTIFFSKDGTVPETIGTMTTNIKNNDYSSSNVLSTDFSYTNTSEENLMQFIMNNVMSVISKHSDATVSNVAINNEDYSNWNKSLKSVTLNSMIPLTGTETPFVYAIEYKINDTTVINGVASYDSLKTILNTSFTVALKESTSVTAPFEILWWERSLTITSHGDSINSINTFTSEPTIRFEESAVDVFYGYSNVAITLKSVKKGDSETLTLDKNGSVFTKAFTSSVTGDQNNNDGILQVAKLDTIIVSFANPKLPLDTISTKIVYAAGTILSISNATWYDQNADGFVDSMAIDFGTTDTLSQNQINELTDQLILAPNRHFEIISKGWSNGVLTLRVNENNTVPNTAMGSGDTVAIHDGVLPSGGILVASSTRAIDSMAPVILDGMAILNDMTGTSDDRLSITFSEPVTPCTTTAQYLGFRRGSSAYQVILLPQSTSGSTVTYSINSLPAKYVMKENDSVKINDIARMVKDSTGNIQDNHNNIERALHVATSVTLSRAEFFDNNSDGFVDSVAIPFVTGESSVIDANELASKIALPRAMTIISATISGSKLCLSATETDGVINTAISSSDTVVLRDDVLSSGTKTAYSKLIAIDSMAPVIMPESATLRNMVGTADDRLTVVFSEPVRFNSTLGRHFDFRRGTTAYAADLTVESTQGAVAIFAINSLSSGSMADGDSLNINAIAGLIKDTIGNVQIDSANVERVLHVSTVITLNGAAMFDKTGDGMIDSVAVAIASGEGCVIDSKDILSLIDLPSARNLTIDSSAFNGSVLAISVTENATIPQTSITAADSITLRAGTIGTATVPVEQKILPADSMAPVILPEGAILRDKEGTANDRLSVEFSEPVRFNASIGTYFDFRRESTPYSVHLSTESVSGTSAVFSFDSLSIDGMLNGDSLNIRAVEALIKDTNGLIQNCSINISRVLRVTSVIDIVSASMHDNSGDGLIDSIAVRISAGEGSTLKAEDILNLVSLPSSRKLSVRGAVLNGSVVGISVSENEEIPQTFINEKDSITLREGTIGTTIVEKSHSVLPLDSMAPVILADGAFLEDSLVGTDYLTVTYSEPVSVSSGETMPHLYTNQGDPYTMTLTHISDEGSTVRYKVNNSTRSDTSVTDDSIWINTEETNLTDKCGITQANPNNIHRPIVVKHLLNPFEIKIMAVTPYQTGITPVPASLALPDFNLTQNVNGEYSGMIIQAQAVINGTDTPLPTLKLSGKLIIHDALGNIVLDTKEMVYVPEYSSLFFVWNGLNENGRSVGSGVYVSHAQVTVSTADGYNESVQNKKLMVGIQTPYSE